MSISAVERFETILAGGADSPSLRFALGTEYAKLGQMLLAIEHLSRAVVQDPKFSAAWKLLGKAQVEAGLAQDAIDSYRKGIRVATQHGDMQAAREMKVFLKRLQKVS
jgi:Tfp pilus assembly protein PilF|tara:strand:- start:340 stop:663 length:324 start_codon:yes stop_codon:yes gene_type:complete